VIIACDIHKNANYANEITGISHGTQGSCRNRNFKVKTKINLRLKTDSRTAQIVLIENGKKPFF